MVFASLLEVERVIRAGWSSETCDPLALDEWSPEAPARGQCAVTALIVQELFGGDLLLAEVHYPDGSRQGLHYRALAAAVRSGLAAATPRDAGRTGGPASGPATAGARGA